MRDERIRNGVEVKDRITGYIGIVICEAKWLNGCYRMTVQSRTLDKDHKPVDSQGFDVEQLEYIGEGINMREKEVGGPMPSPQRPQQR